MIIKLINTTPSTPVPRKTTANQTRQLPPTPQSLRKLSSGFVMDIVHKKAVDLHESLHDSSSSETSSLTDVEEYSESEPESEDEEEDNEEEDEEEDILQRNKLKPHQIDRLNALCKTQFKKISRNNDIIKNSEEVISKAYSIIQGWFVSSLKEE